MAIEQIRIKNAGGSYTVASLGAETNDIKVSSSNPTNLTATLNNLINNKVDKVENASLMTQQEHNNLANLVNDHVSENEFKYDEKITSKREFIVLVQKIYYFN